ncbi:hypothetical protein JOQ06_018144 [Pogonophryne albipinna]|uniref:Uncharacterized protein n=1 Tax=Pogonophryne albipinna TaxID=1090488 RepID=A0AAD6AII8_9TELE|nr:hypothetical protein JOQ06_018144 [Pogonophryne albipinna]
MGNCCCRTESPCGSAEETSGLLKDDSKATTPAGETLVGGSCGPEGDDNIKTMLDEDTIEPKEAVKVKKSVPVVVEKEPNNTQENGAFQKEVIQKASPSPRKGSELKENSTAVKDEVIKDSPADVTTESSAVAEPSEELSPNNEGLSEPNPPPTAAAGQLAPVSAVRQQGDKQPASCALPEGPENSSSSACEEAGPEDTNSPASCESSPGSEPSEPDHSEEEQEASSCVREPETTTPADARHSLNSDQDAQADPECSKEVPSLENFEQDIEEETLLKGQDENGDVPRVEEEEEEDKMKVEDALTEAEEDAEIQEVTGEEKQLAESTADVKAEDETPVPEKGDSAGDGLENSEEDLYRGAEELSESQTNQPESTIFKVEDRCSLAPAVDILSYSEREWKGNTAKSALIRKGYKEMSQSFSSLRRVRGDNYCALRATLFQVLSHSTQLPQWLQEEDAHMLPKRLETQEGLISQWTFPGDCLPGDGTGDATLQLKGYMELLRDTWQAALDCPSAVERQQLCERGGGDVPLFCWLLFARDSSDCPRSFLCNHLGHVGLSAGLEQVEMFLLGYALQCTIQVYRLYKVDTEEFVTYYPDDHKVDWPCVCLVTEDDRHYNVPVVEAAEELHEPLNSS